MRTQTHSTSSSDSGTQLVDHVPVLLHEVIDGMSIQQTDTFVDGTLGLGGHASHLTKQLDTGGMFVGIDADGDALQRAQARLSEVKARSLYVQGNFKDIKSILNAHGIEAVDKILLDLGWGTHTLHAGRGFSFQRDEPLVMTYDNAPTGETLTAYDIVNEWGADSLESIIRGWGDEPFARQIAAAIVLVRTIKPIKTTGELAKVIETVVRKKGKTHPATKTFQAIRIATNNELVIVEETLPVCVSLLKPGGRLALITFHSLEDRIVKHLFKSFVARGLGSLVTKKAQQPQREEILHNPRSRSAKLRIFQKKL